MMPADSKKRMKIVVVAVAAVVALALAVLVVWVPNRERPREPSERTSPLGKGVSVKGAYGRDKSETGLEHIESAGFDTVTVVPDVGRLRQLKQHGLRGVVWLGAYNSSKCSFERDDAWVRAAVTRVKKHPAILAYQITDEPNSNLCPRAPDQMKRRADLVRSLDPGKPTYVTVPTWDGNEGFPYQHFAGTTDIMGLVVYPCLQKSDDCWFKMIDRAIAEANRAGVERYWAVIQNFETDWYRLPSEGELREQYRRWSRSRMAGYFVYQWSPGRGSSQQRIHALTRLNEKMARG